VHAHARIPAFLCAKLQKKLGFVFVTTTHLNFNTAVHYRMLTNWGDATLAVSSDIRDYLTENYKMSPDRIIVSVNGISTESFRADISFDDIADELGLDRAKRRIVHMSRLEKGAEIVAHKLVEMAEDIHAKNADTQMVIIGGGSEFAAVEAKAAAVNKVLGKNYVIMTGPRTDIPKLLASADIFVGVSRAAMEAMCCEKPVILAGWQGYLGVFSEKQLDEAMKTNFTCRGNGATTVENLREDLLGLIAKPTEKLQEIGEYGRKIISTLYSVDKMADDTLCLYDAVRKSKKPVDALISGYYGSNNHGDDVLLQAITDDLRKINPQVNISVISKRPKDTKSIYGVNSFHRFNFPRILRTLRSTNLLIMGGGSLIQDLTSTRSLTYYVFVMRAAARSRAKIMLYANGIGPLRLEKNKRRAVAALEKVEKITLRDERSREVLKELGLKNSNILVTADAAFRYSNFDEAAGNALLDRIQLSGKKYFCVSIRDWKALRDDFVTEMAVFCDYMSEKHDLSPLFIPMQPSNDAEISTKVMEAAKRRSYYLLEDFSIDEILSVMAGAEFLVGMRLHSIIYAASAATPLVGLVYDPKVASMLAELQQKYCLDLDEISSGRLIDYAEEVLGRREEIADQLKQISAELSEKARQNANIAHDIINRDLF